MILAPESGRPLLAHLSKPLRVRLPGFPASRPSLPMITGDHPQAQARITLSRSNVSGTVSGTHKHHLDRCKAGEMSARL